MPERPIAYFLTFRCYGTWVPGDPRGSVARRNNGYGDPYDEPNSVRERLARERVASPVSLEPAARSCVEATIEEVASDRGWRLWAVNARTNHVHLVIGTTKKPEEVLVELKAWSTRRLRMSGLFPSDARIWAKHGSTRYIWTEESLERACHYVRYGQDKEGVEGY